MTKEQEQDIANQIRSAIERELAAGRSPQATWLTQAIVGAWESPSGKDADKWLVCGYANVRNIVRHVVRQYKPDDDTEDSGQLVMDGFEKLHRAYLISREGEQTIVRVDQLTVSEALDIIHDLNRCKRGLDLHINEMQRYIDEVLMLREQDSCAR